MEEKDEPHLRTRVGMEASSRWGARHTFAAFDVPVPGSCALDVHYTIRSTDSLNPYPEQCRISLKASFRRLTCGPSGTICPQFRPEKCVPHAAQGNIHDDPPTPRLSVARKRCGRRIRGGRGSKSSGFTLFRRSMSCFPLCLNARTSKMGSAARSSQSKRRLGCV